MLDVELYGFRPGMHHLTNLLFHLANTLLLFFALHRMTKAAWQSAFVAVLFAVHPLHVQSVAWVAERKDVLCTFFWMLAMGAYVRYIERPRPGSYVSVLAFFALGLMAKPMVVTLPFVLLLLDYWPLRRFEENDSARDMRSGANAHVLTNKGKRKSGKKLSAQAAVKEIRPADHRSRQASIRLALLEKVPFLVLAAISSVVTFIAQAKGEAVISLKELPLGVRIPGVFISYVSYIGKAIWPTGLAVLYPHPGSWPLGQTLVSLVLLSAITVGVITAAKRFPYLATGWLWFTGTLVPVIGIVQVGQHAVADRYTYIPLIGIFIMAAWGIPALLKKLPYRKEVLIAAASAVIGCLFVATWIQVGYWKDSITLFDHTLSVTSRNVSILLDRGYVYYGLGDYRRALEDFDEAIAINPGDSDAYNNRCIAYGALGNYEEALSDCDRAIATDPQDPSPHVARAAVYGKLGNYGSAIEDLDRAVELNPGFAEAYFNRGIAYSKLGDQRRAIADYDRAIEINPMFAGSYNNRGNSYAMLGDQRQAIADYGRALAINPGLTNSYLSRSASYSQLGNRRLAIEDLQAAARFGSQDAENSLKEMGAGW